MGIIHGLLMQSVIYLWDLFSFPSHYSHTFPPTHFFAWSVVVVVVVEGLISSLCRVGMHIRTPHWQNSITCFSGTRIMCLVDGRQVNVEHHAALLKFLRNLASNVSAHGLISPVHTCMSVNHFIFIYIFSDLNPCLVQCDTQRYLEVSPLDLPDVRVGGILSNFLAKSGDFPTARGKFLRQKRRFLVFLETFVAL